MSADAKSPDSLQTSRLALDDRGRFTLTEDILAHIGARPGERLQVTLLPDGGIELKAAPAGKLSKLITAVRSLFS